MLRPVQPVSVADLFPDLHAELIGLLRSLQPEDWSKPTRAKLWTVHDIAAHLLDGDLRKLSTHRDGAPQPPPAAPIKTYDDLVRHLNDLNAQWVAAARRIGPDLLMQLLQFTGAQVSDFVAGLDPVGRAVHAVAWAGETVSANWFDTARGYTERWHHQLQIREAVGAPPLVDPKWLRPVLDISMRALPFTYRTVHRPSGTTVAVKVTGAAGGRWALVAAADGWHLFEGEAPAAPACISMSQDVAWRLLFKQLSPIEAVSRVYIDGDRSLGNVFLKALAVMA